MRGRSAAGSITMCGEVWGQALLLQFEVDVLEARRMHWDVGTITRAMVQLTEWYAGALMWGGGEVRLGGGWPCCCLCWSCSGAVLWWLHVCW